MSYQQCRVYVRDYASLPASSPLLVPVPTAPGRPQQRAHVLVARALVPMSDRVRSRFGYPLQVASGWRPHRWESETEYEDVLVSKYEAASARALGRSPTRAEVVAYGRVYLAFSSAHETGLALDFGCGGLSPVSATIPKQKKTELWQFLHDHASDFGFTPYFPEPWHWELRVPRTSYDSPPAASGPVAISASSPVGNESPEHECCEDESCVSC